MNLSESLYKNLKLKRVYYSAYVSVNNDKNLPAISAPPLLRENRLYQADWLLRFYGFTMNELLDESHPNFNNNFDPKCDWAIRHLEKFPVEVNKADFFTLIRVPGIGVTSAKRIITARRAFNLNFDNLKKLGIVLKRARYFITCNGKYFDNIKSFNQNFITENLLFLEKLSTSSTPYVQTSLFDKPANGNLANLFENKLPTMEDRVKCLSGNL